MAAARGGPARWGALGAGVVLIAVGCAPPARAATEAPADAAVLKGVEHLAHVPKPALLGGSAALNSDLAFTGDYVIGGNYNGFVVYDVSEPESPEIVSEVLCPGGQGDVSVSGDLLYFSVDYPRKGTECGAEAVAPSDPEGFEGIRIFDISDKAAPQYVAAVRTDCGSHTNTLVPGGDRDYVYVSSYSPSESFPNCRPPHERLSIVEVPHDAPEDAAVAATPALFGPGDDPKTMGCHDITAYPERGLAAAACLGDGLLLDISDPLAPVVLDRVRDDNFAFWHSATFTADASTVLFTDELGGGSAAVCDAETGPERGADAVYSVGGGTDLVFRSYYKIPRHQADTENCVAHNGSLIPVPGGDFFVQGWYQGGVSVVDLTDPDEPREIAFFDRGPWDSAALRTAGSWSAYYYNGHVYSNGIQRGLDVLRLTDPRLAPAEGVRMDQFNPQSQPSQPAP
ncbi:LVIVD repeat-containing protein [Nocardiopsis sp. CNT312]|uniref:LVIVD repeat-containing protein n=1 Tax=Nocardiopsis sp. CNT312 TaxID=1137268 RepID=UPI0009DFC3DA|nr:hypothetical protein [Nocardiopsis sp. CNT312]